MKILLVTILLMVSLSAMAQFEYDGENTLYGYTIGDKFDRSDSLQLINENPGKWQWHLVNLLTSEQDFFGIIYVETTAPTDDIMAIVAIKTMEKCTGSFERGLITSHFFMKHDFESFDIQPGDEDSLGETIKMNKRAASSVEISMLGGVARTVGVKLQVYCDKTDTMLTVRLAGLWNINGELK